MIFLRVFILLIVSIHLVTLLSICGQAKSGSIEYVTQTSSRFRNIVSTAADFARRLSEFRDRHEKIDKLRPIFPGMRRMLDIFNEISGENGAISAFS